MEIMNSLEHSPSPTLERETALSLAIEGLRTTYKTLWDPSAPVAVRGYLAEHVLPHATRQVIFNQEQETKLLTDSLTGLYNKGAFGDQFERVIEQTWRNNNRYQTGNSVALMILDLDKFKALNDTYGHATGDKALVGVGDIIKGSIRKSDAGARLGGDEFAFVLGDIDEKTASEKATGIIDDIIAMPLPVKNKDRIGASVGIRMIEPEALNALNAMSPEDRARELKTLLHEADQNMYAVKAERKNNR